MRYRRPLAACLALFIASCAPQKPPTAIAPVERTTFNVRGFDATGDGTTKDTAAFQKALDACAAHGGILLIPAGNYLIGSVVVGGNTTIQFEPGTTITASPDAADYPLMDIRWEGRWRQGHRALLYANRADHIAIVGPGKIVGNQKLGDLRNPRGPCLIEPIECTDLRFDGFSASYRRMWSLHPTYCRQLSASNLMIRSTAANGDGIDVDSCQDVRITHCDIDTGDDAIALKSGRGMEAVRIARPTEDVLITDCTLGSSFAGVGIGTEMSGGVRNVRIERCTFTRGANSIYLKGRIGRGGFIENVSGQDLVANARTFLRFNFVSAGIQDSEPVPGDAGIPAVSNIAFADVKTTAPTFVDATHTSPDRPVQGLSLVNISGTCRTGMALCNIIGVELRDIDVTCSGGPLLATSNVSGVGLMGAEPYRAPATQTTGTTQSSAP